eukprot:XP_011660455.1 PREDICTED: uncharacterized protein LOC105436532 [Strongylocentrotus purpuratus]
MWGRKTTADVARHHARLLLRHLDAPRSFTASSLRTSFGGAIDRNRVLIQSSESWTALRLTNTNRSRLPSTPVINDDGNPKSGIMAFKHRVVLPLIIFFCIQTLHGDAVPITQWDLKRSPCREDVEKKEANCDERSLDSVPQNLPENTEVLSLMYNKLTSLLKWGVKRYPLLTKLDIADNDIRMIESGAFYPLKELQDIHLSFNYDLVLPDTELFRRKSKIRHYGFRTPCSSSIDHLLLYPNPAWRYCSHNTVGSEEIALSRGR